ncbi:MAG: hypothetical protein [Podoviridae sp. ctLUJ1]|nr:MAG: hypothetical protein [Podoviridae sp. ctLUJ1]
MPKPIITLIFPCGTEQHIEYDVEKIGIKGRKVDGKRPIKAIVRKPINVDCLHYILDPHKREIVYESEQTNDDTQPNTEQGD